MKKQIAKVIGSGILASFLVGTIFMIIFLIIIDMQTPNHYEDGRPKMELFWWFTIRNRNRNSNSNNFS